MPQQQKIDAIQDFNPKKRKIFSIDGFLTTYSRFTFSLVYQFKSYKWQEDRKLKACFANFSFKFAMHTYEIKLMIFVETENAVLQWKDLAVRKRYVCISR